MRRTTIAALVPVLACTLAAPAIAHQGDPRFDSVLTGAGIPGLKVQVLNYGDRLALQNRTGRTVTLEGYQNEPYARLLPDGTVQVNQNSPATYLNTDPYANATVPKTASAKATPAWKTIEGDGRYETHDHRIHWMAPGTTPQQVTDKAVRTKIFDWSVPIEVGDRPSAITGTLWWRGTDAAGGMPVGLIVGLVALVVGSIVLVWVVRRRRRGDGRVPADSAEVW